MDFEEIKVGLVGLQWIVTLVVGVYAWYSNREAATNSEVEALKQKIAAMEEKLRHMPDSKEFNKISIDVEAIYTKLGGIEEIMRINAKSLDRLNDYLLNNR